MSKIQEFVRQYGYGGFFIVLDRVHPDENIYELQASAMLATMLEELEAALKEEAENLHKK